jgi:hypothetical protein
MKDTLDGLQQDPNWLREDNWDLRGGGTIV